MKFKKFREDVKTPAKSHLPDVGLDLFMPEAFDIEPLETKTIGLGLGVAIPEGFAGMLVPRSSIAAKGLVIQTSIIDPDYTGEFHVIVTNCSNKTQHIEREQREYTDSLYRMTQGQLIANAGEIEATRICYNALLTAAFEREQLILLLSNDKPLTSVREAWQAEQAENYDMEFSHTILRFCEDIRQAQQPEMTM